MDPADDPTLLTPEELVDYQLKRATRGYAVAEVDALLDTLAAQTERLLGEVSNAEQRAAARGREVEQLRVRVAEAERAAEQAVAAAREVADAIVAEARTEAERLRGEGVAAAEEVQEAALRRVRAEETDLRRRQRLVEEHVERLRQFAEDHRSRLQQHLRHELDRLDELRVPDPPASPDPGRDPLLDEPLEEVARIETADAAGMRWQADVDPGRSEVPAPRAVDGGQVPHDDSDAGAADAPDTPPEPSQAGAPGPEDAATPFDEALFADRRDG